MRAIASGLVLSLCSFGCLAAEVGIGVSAKSDDAWIYVPIDFESKYRLEPSLRYAKDKFSLSQPASQTSSGSTTNQEVESFELGLGGFRIVGVGDNAQLSFGVRIAYVDSKSEVSSITTFPFGAIFESSSEVSQEGFRIAPSIGFEYLIGEHFSIGGEASYSFLDVDGDGSSRSNSGTVTRVETSQESSGTQTQLILRYMF